MHVHIFPSDIWGPEINQGYDLMCCWYYKPDCSTTRFTNLIFFLQRCILFTLLLLNHVFVTLPSVCD